MNAEMSRRRFIFAVTATVAGGASFAVDTALGVNGQVRKINADENCRRSRDLNSIDQDQVCAKANRIKPHHPSAWRTRVELISTVAGAILWIRNRNPSKT